MGCQDRSTDVWSMSAVECLNKTSGIAISGVVGRAIALYRVS